MIAGVGALVVGGCVVECGGRGLRGAVDGWGAMVLGLVMAGGLRVGRGGRGGLGRRIGLGGVRAGLGWVGWVEGR